MAAVRLSQTPQARCMRFYGDIQRLAAASGITCPSSSFWSFLAFNYDPGINLTARDISVGSMTCVCQFCNAHKWARKTAGLCCSSGKVRLPPLHEPPIPSRGLIWGSDYNLQAENWIGILPPLGRVPRRDVILLLQAMFHEVKSHIRSFKYALENAAFPSFSIVIDADKRPHDEHERRYNAPAYNEVAAGEQDRIRNSVLKSRGGALCRISETHRSYDALLYPLLFSYGDNGYHFGIPLHTPGGQPITSSKAL
ncbi:unnamed protein product [Acanthosepion pharaonis]|uniref:Uncharacterized protein n=1 Tax=Acanthosepion pharaonis TaxID=158019 RepID=A0A812D0Y9_ACAPH|nr:unnamed protein product [Sepia pharaonis]